MPELPDLVHVAARLGDALPGRRIVEARVGDPVILRLMVNAPFPDCLRGHRFTAVERRGHFLRFAVEGDLVIVINAMLVGRYRLVPAPPAGAPPRRDPASLMLALTLDDAKELQYSDEKRMGKVYLARAKDEATIPVYGQLGIDLLDEAAFTAEAFARLIAGRRDQVRNFLMDKAALASIGNAYADEILFRARLHPKTFCHKLARDDIQRLFVAVGQVLREAIAEIRGRAPALDEKVRDFLSVRGRAGQPCRLCGDTVRSVRVGAADACFCPTCQPATRALFIDWRKRPAP